MAAGQFCTNPGLLLMIADEASDSFVAAVADRFRAAGAGVLLSGGVARSLAEDISALRAAGATCLAGGGPADAAGYVVENTLLQITGAEFLADTKKYQTEMFGNAALAVVAADVAELETILRRLDGNLTGTVYTDNDGRDNSLYAAIEPTLRRRVGRLLNDKMPTGVAVSPAMNHGGPYPATGHPGFTAVGIPASLTRFGMLACYDNVREERLPAALRDQNASPDTWRYVDGRYTTADVTA